MKKSRKKVPGRRNLALVELILVILFFALSSAILVQVFAKAKSVSEESRAKTLGMIRTQDIAEQWKNDPLHPEILFSSDAGWTEKTTGDGHLWTAALDTDLEVSVTQGGVWTIEALVTEEKTKAGRIAGIRVRILADGTGEVLTELTANRYIPDME